MDSINRLVRDIRMFIILSLLQFAVYISRPKRNQFLRSRGCQIGFNYLFVCCLWWISRLPDLGLLATLK